MRTLRLIPIAVLLWLTSAFPQSNKIVFGPLEGDDAGVLTVRNGEAIGIELWVRTDPDNPAPIIGVCHGLLSEDIIIAERNGMDPEPEYGLPYWEIFWIDGPYVHDPDYAYPIPIGWTCEIQNALCGYMPPCEYYLDTQGEWDLYGTWLMVTNIDVPTGQVYFPFTAGWYPHSGQGTTWAFEAPPGGRVEPEQDHCGLHFVTDCQYIPGDCNHNGVPLELADVICMIGLYRGIISPYMTCPCPPHGNEFPLMATVDSNCVVMELEDVIRQICGYRSDCELWGCPDCPGILGILPRDENRQQTMPSLKSKVKDKRESLPE